MCSQALLVQADFCVHAFVPPKKDLRSLTTENKVLDSGLPRSEAQRAKRPSKGLTPANLARYGWRLISIFTRDCQQQISQRVLMLVLVWVECHVPGACCPHPSHTFKPSIYNPPSTLQLYPVLAYLLSHPMHRQAEDTDTITASAHTAQGATHNQQPQHTPHKEQHTTDSGNHSRAQATNGGCTKTSERL